MSANEWVKLYMSALDAGDTESAADLCARYCVKTLRESQENLIELGRALQDTGALPEPRQDLQAQAFRDGVELALEAATVSVNQALLVTHLFCRVLRIMAGEPSPPLTPITAEELRTATDSLVADLGLRGAFGYFASQAGPVASDTVQCATRTLVALTQDDQPPEEIAASIFDANAKLQHCLRVCFGFLRVSRSG